MLAVSLFADSLRWPLTWFDAKRLQSKSFVRMKQEFAYTNKKSSKKWGKKSNDIHERSLM